MVSAKAKNILTKILAVVLSVSAFLFISTIAISLFVFYNPGKTWELAEKYILPKDLKITWQALDVRVQRIQGLNFKIDATVEKLDIQKVSPKVHFPIEKIDVHLQAYPFAQKKVILTNLKVGASEKLSFEAAKPSEPSEPQSPFQTLQGIFSMLEKGKSFQIENFSIDLKEFNFKPYDGNPIIVQAKAEKIVEAPSNAVHAVAQVLIGEMKVAADTEIWFDHFGTPEAFLKGKVQFAGFGVQLDQSLSGVQNGKEYLLLAKGKIGYEKEKIKIAAQTDLNLQLKPREGVAKLKASLSNLPGPVVKIDSLVAKITVPFENNVLWSSKASAFSLAAPVALFFVDDKMRGPLEQTCQCKIPEFLKAEIQGETWLAPLLGKPASEKDVLKATLKVESVDNKLLSLNLGAGLEMKKKGEEFSFFPTLDSRLKVHSFQGFQKFLDAKGVLIPAPLNVLEGTIDMAALGPVDANRESYNFNAQTDLNLNSSNQKVDLRAVTDITLDTKLTKMDVALKLMIQDLQLQLPPLNPIGGLPKVAPDSRILKKPKVVPVVAKNKKPAMQVNVSVEVETNRPGAIRLLSEFAKPYLPISTKVKYTKGGTEGFVQTENFAIEYIRRTVHVEKMQIKLDEAEKNIFPVDARMRVDQADYKLFVDIKGNIKDPQITFTSDPYLSQDDIISVLIYGRTSEQLDTADSQTAGNFQAAVSDKAIGLFGMWAFAATPIQSFSYNPVTKVYTATILLADGLTAGVGTNWEESARFELRKRVSRQWVLTASWTPGEDGEVQQKLVLQWERRF